jgi:hypothetical protein
MRDSGKAVGMQLAPEAASAPFPHLSCCCPSMAADAAFASTLASRSSLRVVRYPLAAARKARLYRATPA